MLGSVFGILQSYAYVMSTVENTIGNIKKIKMIKRKIKRINHERNNFLQLFTPSCIPAIQNKMDLTATVVPIDTLAL